MTSEALQLALNNFSGFIVQLLLFLLVPFLWWRVRHCHRESLWTWLGLKKPRLQGSLLMLLLFAAAYYILYRFDPTRYVDISAIEESEHLVANAYRGLGYAALLPALIGSYLQTSFTEELLFRGFIAKRLAAKWGFITGNTLQALIFGLMHNALFLLTGMEIGLGTHLLVLAFSGTAGALMFYLNDRIFNGSIIPSILLHGTGNFVANMLTALTIA